MSATVSMLTPYKRRAFLVLAMTALQPAALAHADTSTPTAQPATAIFAPSNTAKPNAESSPASGPTESLWDVLARTVTPSGPIGVTNASPFALGTPAPSPRLALGPVPGFSLPAPDTAAINAIFDKPKPRRSRFGAIGDWFDHLQKMTGSKITPGGQYTLSARMEHISGGEAAQQTYQNERYYGQGSNGIYNDASMTLDASLFNGAINYHTQFSNRQYDNPNDNRVKLDYKTKRMRLEWGDLNAGFQGNSLIDFNRYLKGVAFTNQWSSNFSTSMLYSQTKAETRTITINGEDKSGPYYVFSGQIVDGSARVRVDNREMQEGKDYTLDRYSGVLQFTNSNVILRSSSIAVSYEAFGYNQQPGSIMGARAQYMVRPGLNLGVTYVTQTAQGSQGVTLRKQQFFGTGIAGQNLSVGDQIDTTKPITVARDGVPLIQGVDWVIDQALTNQIRVAQAIPGTSSITIEYYPLNLSITPGNRNVLGLDGTLGLGRLGDLSLETAMSGLAITGNNVRGTAWQARANLHPSRNLNTRITLRSISPTFSSIQSPGFNRTEKALDISTDYSPTNRLRFNANWQKAKRPSYYGYGASSGQYAVSSIGNDTYNQYSVGGSYAFSRNGSLNLTRSNISTQFIVGGHSSNQSDTLGLNYGLGNVNLDASVSRIHSNTISIYNLGAGVSTTTPGSSAYISDTSTLSKRLGLHWTPKSWLMLSGSLSDNDIKNNGTGPISSATARDAQFSSQFSAFRNIRLTYAYTQSDTGNVVPQTTTGTTTTGSGTTSGGTGTSATSSTSTSGSGYLLTTPRSVGRLTRDVSSQASNLAYLNSLAGGGANAGLGPGYFNGGSTIDPLSSSYGINSYGGTSRSHHLAMEYRVRRNLGLSMSYDTSSSAGDYLFNSARNGMNFTMTYDPSDRMHLDATWGTQRINYNNAVGGTNSNTLAFNLYGRPFGGKLMTQFGFQSLRTRSALNLSSATTGSTGVGTTPTLDPTAGTTGTATTGLTDTSSNINQMSLRMEYPINRLLAPFIEVQRSDISGYLGSLESNFRFGVDYALTQQLRLSLGWQLLSHKYKDSDNAQKYNYQTSSLLAELGLRF